MVYDLISASTSVPTSTPFSVTFNGTGGNAPGPGGVITNTTSGVASIVDLTLLVLLSIVVMAMIVGVLVIIVVANRADPDPTGHRPRSVYHFAVSFVALATLALGSSIVVVALVALLGNHSAPIANAVARSTVIGGLITVVSLALLFLHLPKGASLARVGEPASPSRRVGQSYVSAVSFVTVLVMALTGAFVVYLVFAIAGPGVFGSFGGRTPALEVLIDVFYAGAGAFVVFWTHRRIVSPAAGSVASVAAPVTPDAS